MFPWSLTPLKTLGNFPGRHWISTGTGRWDRPAATPEVHLEDFAEVRRFGEARWVDGLRHFKLIFVFCTSMYICLYIYIYGNIPIYNFFKTKYIHIYFLYLCTYIYIYVHMSIFINIRYVFT